uniref:NADH-ubiquinone oxidoreductase chain 2 n=1 Tax=Xenurolebias myersi TaxID=941678 RepID=Q9TD54_9TELE|nr:NADH dehydrogenase subunit II [Xenurolebias myersi]
MSPFLSLTFFSIMILGTLTVLSSSHWLITWVGLEINTFAILPLMAQNHHPRALEATLKYFIVQVTAAMMLLFATMSNAWLSGQWSIQHMTHPIPLSMVIIALALKMGLAPLHAWFPEILQGLSFNLGLILTTWQKLAPLILFLQIPIESPALYTTLGLVSILVGGWGGLNQTQLRKMLAYSSIAHLGWIVLVMQFLPSLAFLVFLMYVIMTAPLFLTFQFMKTTTINSLSTSWAKTPILISLTPLTLFSLGGLPPLTGFLPKWLILDELTKQNMMPVAVIAALSALLSLFFYLRLSYAMSMTMPPNNLPSSLPWRLNSSRIPLFLTILTIASVSLMPLSPSIITFLLT